MKEPYLTDPDAWFLIQEEGSDPPEFIFLKPGSPEWLEFVKAYMEHEAKKQAEDED